LLLSGLKMIFVTIPSMLGGLLLSGLKTIFITIPSMLGGLLLSGLKMIFVTIPKALGGLIINGLRSIFVDLPVWLGKTILNGIISLVSGIPGALYSALYSAASMVGLGWVVKGMAGGGGAATKEAAPEPAASKVESSIAESSKKKTTEAVTTKAEDSLSVASSQETRKMTPTNFKSQFTDEWSEKYHPAPSENLSGSLASPESIKHVDEVVSGKNLSYGAMKESYIGNTMPGPGLDSAIPGQVESVGGKPSTTVPVSVSTASPTTANKANIEQKLLKEKAGLTPTKSEVVSPELGALTTETEEQTVILNQMKELFEQFLDVLKPKSQATSSEGGEPGSTLPKNVVGKPTNYYRRVGGNVGQGPGKATVNLGAKAVS